MTDTLAAAFFVLSIAIVLMPNMASARATAALSNIAFIAYGIDNDLAAILLLNALLLPLNIVQAIRFSPRLRARLMRYATGRRRSTISAHQEQPAGIASSLKS